MEHIRNVNPRRVLWCCRNHGIAPEALAVEAGVPPRALERTMAGEDGLTFPQLRKLATFFQRGVLFFLEPGDVRVEELFTPQFRTIANQKPDLSPKLKALIERAERQRDLYLALCADLGERDQRRFRPPPLPKANVGRAARAARAWLALGERNTFDSYRRAVEAQGILVFQSKGYPGPWRFEADSPVCGFTLYHPDCPVIMLRKESHESRQVFTLMHELGHVLLHQSSFVDEYDDFDNRHGKEQEANAFAGQLLVPDDFLDRISNTTRPTRPDQYHEWLREHRKAWGVSGEVILRRLLDVGRLRPEQYRAYREWASHAPIREKSGGSRKYRHREPKHLFGETFVRTVLDAHGAGLVSLAKASTYLDNLKIRDLHALERHCVGV